MKRLAKIWHEDDGVLSFEWVLIVTLVVIGVVGGLCAARDAIIDELGDLAEAAQGIDQSYTLSPLSLSLTINGTSFTSLTGATTANPTVGSHFQETAADQAFTDCGRANIPAGQDPQSDVNGQETTSGS